ncbi:hypothetical protein HMPREF1221_00872 [Treponema socranskii subsp. paredis ATCC 35535]|nr:hypothetical protein HMPREF1221_00872 [Treponema socranskii subsp. paredis ATCC 35535]
MKGIGFKIIIVSAVFCAVFTACNFNINGGKELAEVRVGSAGPQRAADPLTGLPVFDGSNTTITITDASGRMLAEGPIPFSAEVTIGVEIVVRATVRTASGTWSKTKSHMVKPGVNDIDLELSKTPKVAANLLFSITGKDPSGSNIVSLSTQSGKKLLDGILIGKKPVTVRDQIGRIYVLYEDTSSTHLKRFDVDGNEDTDFQTKLTTALTAAGVTIGNIDNIAIDIDDNYIFLFKQNTVYCFKEKDDHSFKSFSSDVFPTVPSSAEARAVAIYEDVLFAVYDQILYACEFEFTDLPTPGDKRLKFKSATPPNQNLDKLRSHSNFGNDLPECTGLFADDDGVYCLLTQQKDEAGKKYALGQLVRYEYSGSTLTKKNTAGLHSKAGTSDPSLAFEAGAFSNPIGFIGYDEENIYIADDGFSSGYINENWRITRNENRIAAFNREDKSLTFSSATDTTWFAEHSVYKKPNTKMLLWEKSIYSMHYWTGTDGVEAFSEANKLFADTFSERPTDMFCYDQDGNLYIVYRDDSNVYFVRRFILGVNGYVKDNDKTLGSLFDISAVAVDISDGKKTLYYSYKISNNWFVKSLVWNTDFSSAAFPTPPYEIQTALTEITALAANKDGVFVATKEQALLTAPYTLKVAKYKKGSSPVQDGVITVVSASPAENPSPHPATGDYECYEEAVRDLQVIDGVLYGISSKTTESRKYVPTHHETDVFKNSSKLYKIGATASTLSGIEKTIGKGANDDAQTGYGFCRFIAVKYDEAERIKLIIASDGVWGTGGTAEPHGDPKNTDKVLEYDLAGNLLVERNSGGSFSQKLTHIVGTGFSWY